MTTVQFTGQIGNALDFDGNDDRVVVSHDESISLTDKLTMAAWIWANPGSLDGYDLVLNKGASGNNQSPYFGTWEDDPIFGFYDGGWREFYTSGQNLQTEVWYHIAATFDSATDEVYPYLDGPDVGSWSTNRPPVANSEGLCVGARKWGADEEGKSDDVGIYSWAWGGAEIGARY